MQLIGLESLPDACDLSTKLRTIVFATICEWISQYYSKYNYTKSHALGKESNPTN